jgi:hypothetical protein
MIIEAINKLLADQEIELKNKKIKLRHMLDVMNLDYASYNAMIYFIGYFAFFDEHEFEFNYPKPVIRLPFGVTIPYNPILCTLINGNS